ncbi:amino acid-binding protein [Desulfonema ishimotonii]|uniref:Amino acid-binding protein n=1 Tax=Desulfonema ishimotonii TaxID=45657 RepID=A0A401G287_9BACT|nr:ACT domain-containing protein [Desulfonema ishimotonii]GBC63293.1 amino acid-binding protein [Desulfonema ishimotonii]
MSEKFIMTAFGKDRPGIAADVTEMIYENGCRLEDSAMTRLADEFTLILLLSGQEGDTEEILTRECRRLEREKGLSAFIRPVAAERPVARTGFSAQTIRVEGLDQAGIVYKISKYLAEKSINIENLTSKTTSSPQTGAAIYTMKIEALVPDTISPDSLDRGLDQIGNELNVDITVD